MTSEKQSCKYIVSVMMDLFTVSLYRSDPSDNFAPFTKLVGQKINDMSLASKVYRMINILLSRAVLNVVISDQ